MIVENPSATETPYPILSLERDVCIYFLFFLQKCGQNFNLANEEWIFHFLVLKMTENNAKTQIIIKSMIS